MSLLNITSSYIIKQIFSFINYHRFISLIKYNKRYQNILEFNLKSNIHYNKNIEKEEEVNLSKGPEDGMKYVVSLIILGGTYIYFLIHYILNLALNIKLNNESKSKEFFWCLINGLIIKKLLVLIYIVSIHVIYHALSHSYSDYRYTKIIYLFLLDLILIFHFCYEILLIYKMNILFNYAINGVWMTFFDTIYLILNISFIYFTFHIGKEYWKCQEYSRYAYYNYLFLYKDIKIKKYELPDNFNSMKNKRKYLESKANYFEIEYSNNDIELIKAINKTRINKNLNQLIIDYKIPNFIIEGSSEIILSPNNVFKILNTKYVIKLNKEDDFEKIKEDKDIIQILLKPFLDKINIIQQNDIKYITVFEDFDNKYYEIIELEKNL